MSWDDASSGEDDDWDKKAETTWTAPSVNDKFKDEDEVQDAETVLFEGEGKFKGLSMQQLVDALLETEQKLKEARKPVDNAKQKRRAIKEKETAEREARDKQKELEDAMKTETPEEAFARRAAAKAAIQKKVEDADEKLGMELMAGVGDENVTDLTLIEAMEPKSQGDFHDMAKKVAKKATKYKASPFYKEFIKELSISLAEPLTDVETRKWQTQLSIIANEKAKAAQGKKKKKSNKPSLSASKAAVGNEFDDFMF